MTSEETTLVPDIPVPSNNSIIVFSAIGNSPEGGGRLRQNISFSALTDVTVTGGTTTDYVRITPSGNTFDVVVIGNLSKGSTTFEATASTAGDQARGLAPFSASFTFRVLVLGADFPHIVNSFLEFPAGAAVETGLNIFFAAPEVQLLIAKNDTDIVSQTCGTTHTETDESRGNIPYTVWKGEPSGLYLSAVTDAEGIVRGATVKGAASRPGIYYVSFDISSYDRTGSPYVFPGSTSQGMLIINIYDDRDSPRVIAPHDYLPDPDYLRVIRHSVEGGKADRLTGEFTRTGDIWTRRVTEAISVEASDVWEYRIERTGDTWKLAGRNYRANETAPDYEQLASASGRFGEVPPNTGWSGGLLCAGSGDKFVPGSGFFDWKGERELAIAEQDEPFRGAVYEQQPMVTAQYTGWSNPPATQYAAGQYLAPDPQGVWRISNAPLALDGVTVEPQEIRHTALPYHPPTAAPAIGGEHYRDFALLAECGNSAQAAVNAHLPAGENPMFKTGGYVAGVPAHSPWLRQFPPPNSDGTTATVSLSTELEEKTEGIGQSKEYSFGSGPWGSGSSTNRSHSSDDTIIKQKFSGTLELNTWLRNSPDTASGIMCMYSDNLPVTIDYEQHRNFKSEGTSSNMPSLNNHTIELYDETMSSVLSNNGRALLALGSGRNENDNQVNYYAAGTFSAGGNVATKIHHYKEYFYDGNKHVETDENLDEIRSVRGQSWSLKPVRVSLPHLNLSGIAQTEFTGSLTTEVYVARWDTSSAEDTDSWRESVSLQHHRITYGGEGCPPSLVDWGWTHIVKTSTRGGKTQTEDTWHSDVTGSLYAEYRDFNVNVDSIEDPGPPPSIDGTHSYHFEPRMSGTLTEKKVTQRFGQ